MFLSELLEIIELEVIRSAKCRARQASYGSHVSHGLCRSRYCWRIVTTQTLSEQTGEEMCTGAQLHLWASFVARDNASETGVLGPPHEPVPIAIATIIPADQSTSQQEQRHPTERQRRTAGQASPMTGAGLHSAVCVFYSGRVRYHLYRKPQRPSGH